MDHYIILTILGIIIVINKLPTRRQLLRTPLNTPLLYSVLKSIITPRFFFFFFFYFFIFFFFFIFTLLSLSLPLFLFSHSSSSMHVLENLAFISYFGGGVRLC